MHYHYFTLEQRDTLSQQIRGLASKETAEPALEFLRSPEYGVCEACGDDIPYVKLLQDPLLRRCARCGG
jgi:RNA polymerase-binding transcription factor DksA